jgi:hypothetical protein
LNVQHISLIAGDAKDIIFTIDMAAADFSGFTIKWFLTPGVGQEPFLTKDLTNGITSAGQQITIRIKTDDTKEMQPGTYWHELKMFDQNGEQTTLSCGDVVLYAG